VIVPAAVSAYVAIAAIVAAAIALLLSALAVTRATSATGALVVAILVTTAIGSRSGPNGIRKFGATRRMRGADLAIALAAGNAAN
jgi:membrane protein implicated in regulation of membrane protease activity